MSDPIGPLDPELVARALAKAKRRRERLEDVIDRRLQEYADEDDETSEPD